jgi:hypothetical protein
MILEAVNSVFLTFLVTEYLLSDDTESSIDATNNHQNNSRQQRGQIRRITNWIRVTFLSRHSTFMQCLFGVVGFINLFMHYHVSGAAISSWMHSKVEQLFHVPRILIAVASFLIVLYFDCRRVIKGTYNKHATIDTGSGRSKQQWSNKVFFRQLTKSFCILLPVYPFLAVVISFGFLFIVSAFEKLNLPLDVLNMPIYYGTLYGPLSYLYWDVKKKMAASASVNGGVGILGGAVLPR